jgi:hypothetical protein
LASINECIYLNFNYFITFRLCFGLGFLGPPSSSSSFGSSSGLLFLGRFFDEDRFGLPKSIAASTSTSSGSSSPSFSFGFFFVGA